MELRAYQARALELLRLHWRERPLLVAPTGSGKTVVLAEICRGAVARGGRVLIAAHTRQIVTQTHRRFLAAGLNSGILMAEQDPGNAPVVVASVQTLVRRPLPSVAVVLIDEAHRAVSESHRRLISAYPSAFICGCTATPIRLDGQGLGSVGFGAIVEPTTYAELFTGGYLLQPTIYAPTVPDLEGVRRSSGEYVGSDASKRITGRLVDHYRDLCAGSRAVAFACSVEHSRRIAADFSAAGVPAEHLDASHSQDERDAVLARLTARGTLVVSQHSLFGEGWDLPELDTVIMARPTLSLAVFRQQAGRVMRPFPGKSALILDHAGNTLRHGMPWDPIAWSLDSGPTPADRLAPCKRCSQCFAIVPAGCASCPQCGGVFVVRSAVPAETSERLALVEDAEARLKWYAERVRLASLRGYRLGWARVQYRQRYGVWPRKTREIEDAYECRAHEPERSDRRLYCKRCLRTLDPAGRPDSRR